MDTVRFMISGGINIPPNHREKKDKLLYAKQVVSNLEALVKKVSANCQTDEDSTDYAVLNEALVYFDCHITLSNQSDLVAIRETCIKVLNQDKNRLYFAYLCLYDWNQTKCDLILPR